MKEKIKEKKDLYGLKTSILLGCKGVIRKATSFTWQRMVLLSLDPNNVTIKTTINNSVLIRPLCLADYRDQQWEAFMDEKKWQLYKMRMDDPKAHAYGAFVDGHLACSCWIYEGVLEISGKIHLELTPNEVLFFDDYCHPNYRRRGLHQMLNKYRILESVKLGAKKCYVIVYSYNKPALSTQLHSGMHIERLFYIFRWLNHVWCTLEL